MKTIFQTLILLLSVSSFVSCRQNPQSENQSPNENYEMNHKTEEAADSSLTKTDTVVSNGTQTDPAVTD